MNGDTRKASLAQCRQMKVLRVIWGGGGIQDIDPAHHQWASPAVGGAALLAYPLFCPLFFCLPLFYPLPFLRRA